MLSAEEYLKKLQKESYYWPFQATPLGDAYPGTSDLRRKQGELVPHFPRNVQAKVLSARIGLVYDKYVNCFATPAPNGEAVVCVSWLLTTLHMYVNQALLFALRKRLSQGHFGEVDCQMSIYASAIAFHHLSARLKQCTPRMYGVPIDVIHSAMQWTSLQEAYILAHELSHVALGHVAQRKDDSAHTFKEELGADELAAEVICSWFQGSKVFKDDKPEVILGYISAVLYAPQAIVSLFKLRRDVSSASFVSSEDRFQVVCDVFRDRFKNKGLMADRYSVEPFLIIIEVIPRIGHDCWKAACAMGDMFKACIDMADYVEATYFLDMCCNLCAKCALDRLQALNDLRTQLRKNEKINLDWALDSSWPLSLDR